MKNFLRSFPANFCHTLDLCLFSLIFIKKISPENTPTANLYYGSPAPSSNHSLPGINPMRRPCLESGAKMTYKTQTTWQLSMKFGDELGLTGPPSRFIPPAWRIPFHYSGGPSDAEVRFEKSVRNQKKHPEVGPFTVLSSHKCRYTGHSSFRVQNVTYFLICDVKPLTGIKGIALPKKVPACPLMTTPVLEQYPPKATVAQLALFGFLPFK